MFERFYWVLSIAVMDFARKCNIPEELFYGSFRWCYIMGFQFVRLLLFLDVFGVVVHVRKLLLEGDYSAYIRRGALFFLLPIRVSA